jgi:hypothetical protein
MVPGRYLLWEQDNVTAFIPPFSFAARHCAVAAAHDTRLPSSPSSLPPDSLYANATCVEEQDALEQMARADPKVRRIREVGAGEEKTARRSEFDERRHTRIRSPVVSLLVLLYCIDIEWALHHTTPYSNIRHASTHTAILD